MEPSQLAQYLRLLDAGRQARQTSQHALPPVGGGHRLCERQKSLRIGDWFYKEHKRHTLGLFRGACWSIFLASKLLVDHHCLRQGSFLDIFRTSHSHLLLITLPPPTDLSFRKWTASPKL